MPISKTTGKESAHASTKRGGSKLPAPDCESVARFAETSRLRALASTTQAEYLRCVRKLATRHGGDPAALDEAAVRAHLLRRRGPAARRHGRAHAAPQLRDASAGRGCIHPASYTDTATQQRKDCTLTADELFGWPPAGGRPPASPPLRSGPRCA